MFTKLRAAILSLSIVILPSLDGLAAPTTLRSEAELLRVLQSSESTPNQRAKACQDLGAVGGERAVAPLAKLLDDPKTSHYARYALQSNPTPAAGAALSQATTRLTGDLLVGVVNSLGARGDSAAVPRLTELLRVSDKSVAIAAAGALADIGADEALATLRGLPIDEHLHLCQPLLRAADALLKHGDQQQAVEVFRAIAAAPVAAHLRRSASLRLVDAVSQQEAIELMASYLASDENWKFEAGVQSAVRSADPMATRLLADRVAGSPLPRQLQLLAAIASRADRAAVDAVRGAVHSDSHSVRATALRTLGSLGDASDIALLVAAAGEDAPLIRDSAIAALCAMDGQRVEKQLITLLKNPDASRRATSAQIIGRRRMEAAGTELVALASSDKSPAVRLAAVEALARIAPPRQLNELLNLSTTATSKQQNAARKAALATALRVSDRKQAAELVASQLEKAPAAQQGFLFDVLGAIGGERALAMVAGAAASPTRQLQNEATRVLGSWPTRDAAPVLLDIASCDHPYRVRALRGYLRIVRQFDFSDSERVEMVGRALALAEREEERLLALTILEKHASAASLKLAQSQLESKLLGQKASESVINIAEAVAKRDAAAAADAAREVLKAGGQRSVLDRARRLASSSAQ